MRKNGSDSTSRSGRMIRKGDLILILVLLMTALGAFGLSRAVRQGGDRVVVRISDREYGAWPLSEDREILIEENGFRNLLVIRDGKARMKEADCPDKICVNHVPISYVGESIICLPHRIVVSIESGGDGGKEPAIDAVSR